MVSAFGQNPYLILIFTAVDDTTNVQIDSIKVMNRTQHCDTVLYWPDTVLILGSQFGTSEFNETGKELQVFQNYPNPATDHTTISIYIPEKDELGIIITDVMGRVIVKSERVLDRGIHVFEYLPANTGISFFTVFWRGETSSISILCTASELQRIGSLYYERSIPTSLSPKSCGAIENFIFSFGDTLRYTAYAKTVNEVNGSDVIEDAPQTHETYKFDITEGIPCHGTHTVNYGGQVYNTVQIGSQCWLKENLNVGTMLDSLENATDNGIIEKYCYRDQMDNCIIYGGLYHWDEMMQYSTQASTQGICPPGWHLPSLEEWLMLIEYLGGEEVAGGKMRETGTTHWNPPNTCATNISGFTALPGGTITFGLFIWAEYGLYATSTEHLWFPVEAFWFMLGSNGCHIALNDNQGNSQGISVRCVKE